MFQWLQPPVPSPLVIIPGDGGSQAFASVAGSPLFSVWINFNYLFLPNYLEKYFMLAFDAETGRTNDPENVTVVFPGWGETWSIESLDTYMHDKTTYFLEMVQRLSSSNGAGLIKNKTLRGTPFDFRKAPNELSQELLGLKMLIEETYENSGKERVIILAHSYGNIITQNFLRHVVDEKWKSTYLRAYIAVSAPLGGAVKAMKIEASGDNLGVILERAANYRPVQRSLPSTAILMPHPKVWGPDEPIAFTGERNYTAHDYAAYFEDMGFSAGYDIRAMAEKHTDPDYIPTGIDELYCFYGVDMPTEETLHWPKSSLWHSGFPDEYPTIVMGPGDGTVNLRSLEVCKKWPGVVWKTFSKVEHMTTVRNPLVIEEVEKIIMQGDSCKACH